MVVGRRVVGVVPARFVPAMSSFVEVSIFLNDSRHRADRVLLSVCRSLGIADLASAYRRTHWDDSSVRYGWRKRGGNGGRICNGPAALKEGDYNRSLDVRIISLVVFPSLTR